MRMVRIPVDKCISQIPRNVNPVLREKIKQFAAGNNGLVRYAIFGEEKIYGPFFYKGKTYYTWTSSTFGSVFDYFGVEIDKKYPQRK